MDKQEVRRPLILEIEDAKTEIVQCINGILNRGLPCYIVEMILADAYAQVRQEATRELEQARAQVEEDKDKEVV